MCVVYNAEHAKLCDEVVCRASVAIKKCRRDSYQVSVCRGVLVIPGCELSGLTRVQVIIHVLGMCRSGMCSIHHGQNGSSSACGLNPSSIFRLCWMITGEGSLVGLSPTCCSGLEVTRCLEWDTGVHLSLCAHVIVDWRNGWEK
jgi:hypothetical protein